MIEQPWHSLHPGTGEYGTEEISEFLGAVVPESGVNGGVVGAVEAGGPGGVFGVLRDTSDVQNSHTPR